MPDKLARFGGGHQAARGKLAPSAAKACGASDPKNGLQVTQAAGAFLEIGLEVVRCILIAKMPLLLLECFRFKETAYIERCGEAIAKALVQCARSNKQAMLEETGADGHIVGHLGLALIDGANAVADFESGVPQHADKAFEVGLRIGRCAGSSSRVHSRSTSRLSCYVLYRGG